MKKIIFILFLISQYYSSLAFSEDVDWLLEMATCQKTWLDWERDRVKMQEYYDKVSIDFKKPDEEHYYIPRSDQTILGYSIKRLYPSNVGMGLGFSVLIDQPFLDVKESIESQTDIQYDRCENSHGKACQKKIAQKKKAMLIETDGLLLFGCYYHYQR